MPMFRYEKSNIPANVFHGSTVVSKNPHFVGREQLLEKLRNKLCDEQPNKFNHWVALFGMGGVGKTQVAIEYVVTYKRKYNSVFWITAVDQASLILGFHEIAVTTKCANAEGMDGVSVAREVLRWLEKQNSWLLVMDNVDDISIVNNYLPNHYSTTEWTSIPS
jgi:general stress protein CsbA